MPEKLIIYLHANDLAHPSWAVVTENNTLRQSALHDNVDGLTHIAANKEVIIIVPAEDVLLTTITLPKMSYSRLMQAIPYALEDQLIDEVEELHFALGEANAAGERSVAVVTHAKMQQWQSLLQSWQLTAHAFIPAMLTLPVTENAWYMAIDYMALVRTDIFTGFGCDKNNLSELLDVAIASGAKPQCIYVRNYTQDPVDFPEHLLMLVKETVLPEEKMIVDVIDNLHTPTINLLQGSYVAKKSVFPALDYLWRITAGLAVAWVILLFCYPTISFFILKQRENKLDQQILSIYQRNFPQAKSVIAPKLRLQEKLRKLTMQGENNRLLSLLAYVGKSMSVTENIKLKRFDFQNNQLTLELTAATSDDFSAFANNLTQQGLRVNQQNATLAGARINATVVIE